MIIDSIVAMFPAEVRNTDAMRAVIALTQTLSEQLELTKIQLRATQEQLQATQEQLTKANERIKTLEDELAKFRKTPKKPKFDPNKMQPRERNKKAAPSEPIIPTNGPSFVKKEVSEIKITVENVPKGSRFRDIKHLMCRKSTRSSRDHL